MISRLAVLLTCSQLKPLKERAERATEAICECPRTSSSYACGAICFRGNIVKNVFFLFPGAKSHER